MVALDRVVVVGMEVVADILGKLLLQVLVKVVVVPDIRDTFHMA